MPKQLITETETWRRVEEFIGQKLEVPEGFDPYVDDSIRHVGVALPTPVFKKLTALADARSVSVGDLVRQLIDNALVAGHALPAERAARPPQARLYDPVHG